MAHGYKRSPPLGKASGMPYGVLLGRRSTNRLGCARSSREARVMHAPPQEGHRGPRRPQRGRITSKLKRVWVATGTSCPRWSKVKDRSTNSGAQRPTRGVGARSHHTARQPTPVPPGTRVRLVPCTHSASTEVSQGRRPAGLQRHASGGCHPAVAVRLARGAPPCACRGW